MQDDTSGVVLKNLRHVILGELFDEFGVTSKVTEFIGFGSHEVSDDGVT